MLWIKGKRKTVVLVTAFLATTVILVLVAISEYPARFNGVRIFGDPQSVRLRHDKYFFFMMIESQVVTSPLSRYAQENLGLELRRGNWRLLRERSDSPLKTRAATRQNLCFSDSEALVLLLSNSVIPVSAQREIVVEFLELLDLGDPSQTEKFLIQVREIASSARAASKA